MTTYRFCMAGLALGLLLLCSHQPGQAGSKATELQGAWTVVSYDYEGEPYKLHIGVKFTFDGDMLISEGPGKKKPQTGQFVLDPTSKPKQIDFQAKSGIDQKVLAIYHVKGDMLKICFDKKRGSNRPGAFTSNKDEGIVVMVLRRDKK